VAVSEAIQDETGGIAINSPVGLDLSRGQHGGPSGLDGPIGVILQLAACWFLAHQQKSLALGGQRSQKLYKIAHV